MRIINKKEFFKLEPPFVFSYYNDVECDGLYECNHILRDEKGNGVDYGFYDLISGSYDLEDNGQEFKLDISCGFRDGRYDNEEKFVIYNKRDIAKLSYRLKEIANSLD